MQPITAGLGLNSGQVGAVFVALLAPCISRKICVACSMADPMAATIERCLCFGVSLACGIVPEPSIVPRLSCSVTASIMAQPGLSQVGVCRGRVPAQAHLEPLFLGPSSRNILQKRMMPEVRCNSPRAIKFQGTTTARFSHEIRHTLLPASPCPFR